MSDARQGGAQHEQSSGKEKAAKPPRAILDKGVQRGRSAPNMSKAQEKKRQQSRHERYSTRGCGVAVAPPNMSKAQEKKRQRSRRERYSTRGCGVAVAPPT